MLRVFRIDRLGGTRPSGLAFQLLTEAECAKETTTRHFSEQVQPTHEPKVQLRSRNIV